MPTLAHKSREQSDCEHIAEQLARRVEAFRDGRIYSDIMRGYIAGYLAELDVLPVPHDELWEPTYLLATTTSRWARAVFDPEVDLLTTNGWRRAALALLDLVQTTMHREAGRMP